MTTRFPEPPRVEELDGVSAKLRQNLQRWMSDLKRWGTGGGLGTVTSITATLPAVVTPSPLTTVGVVSVNTMTGDSGAGGLAGAVPAPAGGDTAAGKFLKASGAWAVPSAAITTQDEGVTLSAGVTTVNFVGAGVTASGAGATTTVTIPGGGTGTVTSITATAPIIATPSPITGVGVISASVFVASGASHATGIVPDPGAVAGATKFLREDATWATPGGGASTFDWGKAIHAARATWGF